MTSIPLYLSPEHPCSYLDDKTARNCFIHPSTPLSTELYSELIAQGFRRSGDQVYRPHCTGCSACIPLRIPINEFTPNRNQKRSININILTRSIVIPAQFEQKHYDLYLRYQSTRHADSSMANASPEDYMQFLTSNWCDTLFVEFTHHGELLGIAVVDRINNGLSAVYTFFDPKFSHLSPGRYAVLWQIDYARQLGMQWLYLGFWIGQCQKMSYKNEYRPVQAFIDNQWRQFDKNQIMD